MHSGEQFTPSEAAFVLREPLRAIKKALDKGPVRPVLRKSEGTAVRMIGLRDLVYLHAEKSLRDALTPKARAAFYEALQAGSIKRDVTFGRFRIAMSDLVEEVRQRTAKLGELADRVEHRSDGEPLLKGKDVEVYRIAALLAGGMSVEEILSDYPSLARADIETAKAYATAYPKLGRPYPRTTAKRALKGAGLEALDEVLDDASG